MSEKIFLTRNQLAKFLPTPEAIKAFENLFKIATQQTPNNIEEVQISAESALSMANYSLSVLDNVSKLIEALELQPPETPTISEDIIDIPVVNINECECLEIIKEPDWNFIKNHPTTISGYGITDAYTQVVADSPLTGSGTTSSHLSIPAATSLANGYLSSTDWSTFNNKQSAYTNLSSIGSLANSSGWLHNDGSGVFAYSTPTKSDVGLGNVTNNTQVKAITSTANKLVKFSDTASTIADSVIYDDGTNIGIGTSSPATKMHISGLTGSVDGYGQLSIYASDSLAADKGGQITLGGVATSGGGLQNFGAIYGKKENATSGNILGYVGIATTTSTGAVERMRIDSRGNVGIGTSSPNGKLDVGGTILAGNQGSNVSATNILLNGYGYRSGASLYGNVSIRSNYTYSSNTGDLSFYTSEGGLNTAERMRIDSRGNVGIGVTPSGWYSSRKAIQIGPMVALSARTSNDYLDLSNNAYESAAGVWNYIASSNAASRLYQQGGAFTWYTAPLGTAGNAITWTNAMTLNASGNLGVGVAPSYKLHLVSDSAAKPSTNTWTISSDERLKENIELADLDRCYEIVKTIPLKRYTWKDSVYTQEQVSDRSKLGWIANDVQTVFPKAVNTHSQQLATFKIELKDVEEQKLISEAIVGQEEIKDEDGNIIQEFIEAKEAVYETITVQKEEKVYDVLDDCLDLNSDQIYAVMYGAIQKLQAKIEALEMTKQS